MPSEDSYEKQIVEFDDSGLQASLNFLRDRTDQNLKMLSSAAGNKLAYAHYMWSSDTEISIAESWSEQLSSITWTPELEDNVKSIRKHILSQDRTKWLREVLAYLPPGHRFNTTVYLNLGYDHIVFGENVALNLNSRQFSLDARESVYYLIHELAHAGYVRYHALPELWGIKTNRELLSTVKFLTHLEGMGVLSAYRLRIADGGLLDNDYKTLLNHTERIKRVREYFKLLHKLESSPDKNVEQPLSRFLEPMSNKKTRLWYITGCHMAQEIEKRHGKEALRELVKQGSQAFFDAYSEIAEH